MKASDITLDDVAGAYAATGLKPMEGSIAPSNGCCCAMGALAMVANPEILIQMAGLSTTLAVFNFLDIESHDGWEFVHGFDNGFTNCNSGKNVSLARKRGNQIGKAMRKYK